MNSELEQHIAMPRTNSAPRIVCLSNVYDQQYLDFRGEAVPPSLSHPKRRNLFECLEAATGLEVFVLSSPPKALASKKGPMAPRR